jgi:uncharacterized membrane protein
MESATALAIAFAIGVVAGLRSMTAPAVVSWGARLGWIDLQNTWAAFLGSLPALYLLTAFAIAELVVDKLPRTPSRKSPGPFAARVVIGAFCGAVLCMAARQSPLAGAVLGALGGVAGTLGGYQARTGLVRALKAPDLVIALLEDAIAVGGGLFLVSQLG